MCERKEGKKVKGAEVTLDVGLRMQAQPAAPGVNKVDRRALKTDTTS